MHPIKINFIIPVRNSKTVNEWDVVLDNLSKTIQSITNQTNTNWHCFVVCNYNTDLPNTTEHTRITILEDNFPLITLPCKNDDPEKYHDLIRLDKGLRVYKALRFCSEDDYIMVVDYDDFIHKELLSYIQDKSEILSDKNKGFCLTAGYYYSGGSFALLTNRFDEVCGTSNIVKVSYIKTFYDELGELPTKYVKIILGSHRYLKGLVAKNGFDYFRVNKPMVIYNVGINNSASQSSSIIKVLFSPSRFFQSPKMFFYSWASLRLFNKKRREDYSIE